MERRPILVGVDGSEGSLDALRWATTFAADVGLPLQILCAFSPWAGWVVAVPPFSFDDYKSTIESEFGGWCASVADSGVEYGCSLVEEEAATALLRSAGTSGAYVIVLGAHGGSRWSRHVLGSVTAKVLHHTATPAVVVPQDAPPPVEPGVVVGVDGSPASRDALAWAADLCAATGRSLRAVTVVPAQLWHEQPSFSPHGGVAEGLERLAAEVGGPRGLDIGIELPVEDPAEELVRRGSEAELLVLGSRGHTSIGEVVFGSVSRHCATHCARPVVIVPAAPGGGGRP